MTLLMAWLIIIVNAPSLPLSPPGQNVYAMAPLTVGIIPIGGFQSEEKCRVAGERLRMLPFRPFVCIEQ